MRRPSRRMAEGSVTHIGRTPVDVDRAFEQHRLYVSALAAAGWSIREVPARGGRTDGEGVRRLRRHPAPRGRAVVPVPLPAPRSAALFDDLGFDVAVVDIGEFERMEGCLTCLSVLVRT